MRKLLVIDSSPLTDSSKTRQLTQAFATEWKTRHPDGVVTLRDVGVNPPPHLDETTIGAYYTPESERTPEQQAAIALSDELIAELEAADTIVIGSPMHNFSITSALKTYIDHITRVGRTFRYTEQGPEGLLQGKKVYVLSARGGRYDADSPASAMNHQDTYLKTVLGFIGLTDVSVINAEGVAMSEEGLNHAKQAVLEAVG